MGQTITEKILSRASGESVKAEQYVSVLPDLIMAHDGNRPIVTDVLKEIGFDKPKHPDRLVLVMDHGVPTPNAAYANVQSRLREFADEHGVTLYEQGSGISHVMLPERGHVRPGDIIIATDSHTTTYGALNCLGTGVGATDLAVAIGTGSIWLRVPKTIRVQLTGKLVRGVYARDISLRLLQEHGTHWATYRAVEYGGSGISQIDMDGRFTLTNKAIEFGAKFGVMPFDETTRQWLRDHGQTDEGQAAHADADAEYEKVIEVDLNELEPLVAAPHSPGNVRPVSDLAGTRVDQGFIGTCTNSRIGDLRAAAEILRGRKIAPKRRLIVIPGSQSTYKQALQEGIIEIFLDSGAIISPSGCGPCAGVQGGIPASGQNVIATAPRNFKGRMGNRDANIYLASPATVAASLIAGEIVSPQQFLV